MNPGNPPTDIDAQALARLTTEARAVVDAVDELALQAADTDHVDWAQLQSRQVHAVWRKIVAALHDAQPDGLVLDFRGITAMTHPLGEAPPELQTPAYHAADLCDVLAADTQQFFPPLIVDGEYTPAADARLREIMPVVAAQLSP